MKNRRIWISLAAGFLACAALTACGTAYAATGAGPVKSAPSKESEALPEKPDSDKSASAQDAFDAFRDALGRGTPLSDPRTITVNASGTAKAVPDKAEISFGVTTRSATADGAQEENAKTIETVIDHLKKRGVDEKSIQTSNYNLYPDYDYNGKTPKITGYQVQTTLTVSDQDIDEAGDIVAECIKLGINDVNNFRFYASNYDDAYEEALAAAVKAADKKAAVLAASADGELGRVLSISEGYQNTAYRYAKSNYAMEEAAADMASGFGMSVMPGEADITAQVTVTYQLN